MEIESKNIERVYRSMLYTVSSGSLNKKILAKNRFQAVKEFVRSLKREDLGKLGQVITVVDSKGEEYPCATAPLLYVAKKIDANTAIENIMLATGLSRDEAILVLHDLALEISRWYRR